MITLVLGGTRSGKSEYAEALAARMSDTVTYVATGVATDADMAARIAAHQSRRPASWTTAEVGTDLARRLAAIEGVALVDSLGTWVAASRDLSPNIRSLCEVLVARTAPTIIVSEEVGLGVHAPTDVGRRFTDALGDLNRAVATMSSTVLLVVAGQALPLTRADQLPLPVPDRTEPLPAAPQSAQPASPTMPPERDPEVGRTPGAGNSPGDDEGVGWA